MLYIQRTMGDLISIPHSIVAALARANYEYESDTHLENGVQMRVNLIHAMHRIHDENVNVGIFIAWHYEECEENLI